MELADELGKWLISPMAQRIIASIILIICAFIIWKFIKRVHDNYVKKKNDEMSVKVKTVSAVINDIIKVCVFFLVIIVILQINGINITSVIAGVGVAGAVVGLALQDLFKDIIMGVHILTDEFFQIGDLVKFENEEGTIIAFNLRTTKIKNLANGDIINVCNRNIDKIIKSSPEVYVRIPLPYELPVGKSAKIMQKICEKVVEHEEITESAFLGTADFTGSGVEHLIRIDIVSPDAKLRTRRYVLQTARELLEEEDVQLPYNQLDVHLVSGEEQHA